MQKAYLAGVAASFVAGACFLFGFDVKAQLRSPTTTPAVGSQGNERFARALLAAYPAAIVSITGNSLRLSNGTTLPLSDGRTGKSADELLSRASVVDMFHYRYPAPGAPIVAPAPSSDPGRIRNNAFFDAVYGDCTKTNMSSRLVSVRWVGGERIQFHPGNGAAVALERVARELERLPSSMRPYMTPTSGTLNCRAIAGTNRMSMHGYGVAIDLNTRYGEYWRWSGQSGAQIRYRNRFPVEIVEVFERNGFVWGGRWYHYDTFHFEYRPEFLALTRGN